MKQLEKTKHCYNTSAEAYAQALLDELEGKSLDRLVLKRFAAQRGYYSLSL